MGMVKMYIHQLNIRYLSRYQRFAMPEAKIGAFPAGWSVDSLGFFRLGWSHDFYWLPSGNFHVANMLQSYYDFPI